MADTTLATQSFDRFPVPLWGPLLRASVFGEFPELSKRV